MRKPILLGLSGGPDSLALFYLLMEMKAQFHVAHVDHGWRKESAHEAEGVKALCEKYGVPCHLKKLAEGEGKTEESARSERLLFFKEIVLKVEAQATLLGHHADDLAETVLKRILEGASLAALAPMRSLSNINGLVIWRPFLSVKKEDILLALGEKAITYFDDRSNRDSRYLRARMRDDILPQLSHKFGKKVTHPLCQIAEEAEEWADFMDHWELHTVASPFGWMVNLEDHSHLHSYVFKFLIKKKLAIEGITPSKSQLQSVTDLMNRANKRVEFGPKGTLYFDRNRVFFVRKTLKISILDIPLACGSLTDNEWCISVTDSRHGKEASGWEQVWKGAFRLFLPKKSFVIKRPTAKDKLKSGQRIDKVWCGRKVPTFLRYSVPAIFSAEDGLIYAEPLSKKNFFDGKNPYFCVEFEKA